MLAAIALLGPTAVGAATGELVTPQAVRFERVDAVRGFPQSSIYSLTERDDGYLWLATLDGLVRFDGLRQRTYDRSTNPELSTSRLTALFDHRASGDLWIGAEDGSVIRLRDGRFSALANAGEPLGGVTGLHVSDDGRRLFVFRQGGVVELEITGGDEPEVERAGPPRRGMSVYGCGVALLAGDELWQAGPGGLFAVPLPPSLIGRSWRGCRIEPDGTIWIRATGSDIWRIDGDRIERYERSPAVPEDALPLLEDARGDLWLRFLSPPRLGRLAADGQVLRYDEAFGVDPLGDPVAAHVDREGGLWIGTTIGVYRHLGEAISGLHLRADGVDTAVSVHHEAADGTVWIAGRDASLSALRPGGALVQFTVGDQAGRQILRPELSRGPDGQPWSRAPLGLNAVAVFREDDAGWLWIGVDIGLLVHRGDGEIVIHRADADDGISIPGGVNDLLIDEGGLWLATPLAVVRFEDGRVRRIYGPDEGIKEGVLALLRDHEGVLWAATRAGVLRLRDGRFEAIEGLGPAIGQARALHEDGEGRLWIGTYDRGLFRLRADGAVEHAGPAEGMPAGVFTLHFDDRGFLWTTSNRGLSRTRVAAVDRILGGGEGRISATLYDRSAGLPASECNGGFGYAGYACGRDAWCVHTMGGVGVAHPGAVRVVDAPPRPVIESARIDGVRRSIDDGSLAIAPEERDLVIRYTGVTFDRATEVTFRHRMFGHDGRWIDAETRREALFSDLPPGEYTFEVIAESGEGVESPSPARLAVIVEPGLDFAPLRRERPRPRDRPAPAHRPRRRARPREPGRRRLDLHRRGAGRPADRGARGRRGRGHRGRRGAARAAAPAGLDHRGRPDQSNGRGGGRDPRGPHLRRRFER